ncbi:uncharacterized protein LOC101738841 isoform X2 [Bombyx mori]|uniref:Protein sleepless n=1 Tax=Bombyx mori TaxID=7091 RepID=A0A8R2DL05_BOMMO|nr:uncharacterized protein LOC101738841 isoform X2 [Bombyx mori]
MCVLKPIIVINILETIVLTKSLLCFNGTFSYRKYGEDPLNSKVIFNSDRKAIFRMRCSLTISCSENAMCFVRSWMARAHNSWLVQRGCYLPSKNDALPHSMSLPTRAMTCKHERLADAEYKVCLCKADWCNSGNSVNPYQLELVLSVSLLYYQI